MILLFRAALNEKLATTKICLLYVFLFSDLTYFVVVDFWWLLVVVVIVGGGGGGAPRKMKEKKANTDMCRLRQTTKWPARYKIL